MFNPMNRCIFCKTTEGSFQTREHILPEPTKPAFVCRTLLKMAIETVATDDADDAFSECFDEARNYAISGVKASDWWYLQVEDYDRCSRLFTGVPEPGDFEIGLEVF